MPMRRAIGTRRVRRIGELPLQRFIGPCRLVDLTDLEALIASTAALPPRLLVRTAAPAGTLAWPALQARQIEALARRGIDLIGIDTPSIDWVDSTTLPAHQAARQQGLIVLEGLSLDEIEPGDYELIALPLKLMDAEASPMRAILRRPAQPDTYGTPRGA
jgi:arylformamidase